MRGRPFLSVALLAAILLAAGLATAQMDVDLDWHTTEAGGQSSGGPFTLSGVLGQPDAGGLAGEEFLLEGGFWSAAIVRTSSTVHLPIVYSRRALRR